VWHPQKVNGQGSVHKYEEKWPHRRPRQIWVGNIKLCVKYDGKTGTGLAWLRIETSDMICEYGNEDNKIIKC